MALNDVSLTSGMRSNLLSLQNTVELLDRTQTRLSTGKKVNTAIDNPVSYFASQSLTSRASVIDSLKDAMGQAVQTITAADKGITALTAMIEQAKGIAQSALSAAAETDGAVTLTMGVVSGGTANTVDLTVDTSLTYSSTISIAGVSITATSAASADGLMKVTGVATTDALALKAAIEATTGLEDYVVTVNGAAVNIALSPAAADPSDITVNAVTVGAIVDTLHAGTTGETIVVGGVTLEATFSLAEATASSYTKFYVGNSAVAQTATQIATSLAAAINGNTTLDTAGYSATSSAGVVSLQYEVAGVPTDVTTADVTGTHAHITEADIPRASAELASLQTQYNTMRTQMTELAEDAGYKGKNLLSATALLRSLTVEFEGADLTVTGFNATAAGLGITESTWITTPIDSTKIASDIDKLDAALVTMRQESSKLSGNLSIITVRQDFSTNMINTLTEGSDKLTLADSNEEGANMLMLQTRQSLSTTALSLSAQAAQSVLQLFQ